MGEKSKRLKLNARRDTKFDFTFLIPFVVGLLLNMTSYKNPNQNSSLREPNWQKSTLSNVEGVVQNRYLSILVV